VKTTRRPAKKTAAKKATKPRALKSAPRSEPQLRAGESILDVPSAGLERYLREKS
jgi:hypothetical protein